MYILCLILILKKKYINPIDVLKVYIVKNNFIGKICATPGVVPVVDNVPKEVPNNNNNNLVGGAVDRR